ncbi:MAG: SLATT domain-containing protein [Acidobacteriota bacterium]|nr:SLATT domain-containing protein [Acidobacteriota bacterium]
MPTPQSATPPPVWSENDPMGSLAALFQAAVDKCQEQINWYKTNLRWKRWGSRACRAVAIILIGIGSLLPLVAAAVVGSGLWDSHKIYFGFGYVAFALAAGFLGFDKYFGLSTGWLRFIRTQLVLEGGVDKLKLDWVALIAMVQGGKPTPDQVQALLRRLQTFTQFVDSTVEQETNAWILEFQASLAELVKAAEANANAQKPGQVLVSVSNAKELDSSFAASLDGVITKQNEGGQFLFHDVPPGDHRVLVTGSKSGQPQQDAQIVTVPPGGKCSVSLTLTPS